MLKAAFIGCGGIARAHAPGWRAVKAAGAAEVVALCDPVEGNVKALAEALALGDGDYVACADWRTMLADIELDAVDICLPHHLHAPAILDCAAANVAVLCEKPLCMSLEEAAQITAAVEGSGITLMCAHNQLFFPAVRYVREQLAAGALGQVQQVFSADCFRTARTREEWGWRAELKTAGGGVLIDTGYHPTYRLLHLAGSEPTAVTAMCHNYQTPIEGEGTAHVLVKFANQALGYISTSWDFPLPHGHWQVCVFGSEGSLFGHGNKVVVKPYNGQAETLDLPAADGFAEEVKHFVDCLLTGATPIQTHLDGINVLKLILGAYEAERTGATVTF